MTEIIFPEIPPVVPQIPRRAAAARHEASYTSRERRQGPHAVWYSSGLLDGRGIAQSAENRHERPIPRVLRVVAVRSWYRDRTYHPFPRYILSNHPLRLLGRWLRLSVRD